MRNVLPSVGGNESAADSSPRSADAAEEMSEHAETRTQARIWVLSPINELA